VIQTVRCLNCGQAIDAFIDMAAGIPPGMSRQVIETKVQTARIRHADSCPGRRVLTSPPAGSTRSGSTWSLAGALARLRRRARGVAL
jgi:hypothetical protein